ncbi:MAG: helix-turn-helix domain-containing protein [Bacteroidaceae bacterium]|nr:helix-turn-helix domain-containing protein [Bacteroidaceae bacterium]
MNSTTTDTTASALQPTSLSTSSQPSLHARAEEGGGYVNREVLTAWQFVEYTDMSVFLTGKAGTGKTTFLHKLIQNTKKRCVVLAPTGVAAINAGGSTIHSFFQLPLSPFVPGAQMKTRFDFSKQKRSIIASLDLLIIDEVSMVRCDLMDAIDNVLRRYRVHHLPFGGVQLLMIGDLAQLTPVVTPDEEQLLKRYYDTPYFFGSKALSQIDYVTVELQHVYRQRQATFVELLNHVREGRLSTSDLATLNARYQPHFTPAAEDGYIRLTTHNLQADRLNQQELLKLPTPELHYRAEVEDTFPESLFPTAETLCLRKGAQVMFIKNDSQGRYYNGLIGRVVSLSQEEVIVQPQGSTEEIDVPLEIWENTRYRLNEKTREIESEVLGTFMQYPLRLAWSITIHKSQGLTFDRAIIDANYSFAPGQVYVALSRCRTLEGMVLTSPLDARAIINDASVDSYLAAQQVRAQQQLPLLPTLKQEYQRHLLIELFDMQAIAEAEHAVLRIFEEYMSMKYHEYCKLHRQAEETFHEKVMVIAQLWTDVIRQQPIVELEQEAFQQRIVRGAAYFYEQLTDIFASLIPLTEKVKTENKQAAKLLKARVPDLRQACMARRFILQRVAQKGFSVATYLKDKQTAVLDAIDEKKLTSKTVNPKNPKTKEPKVPTHAKTYQLFKQGMSVEDISRVRQLTVGTICQHLCFYIKSGQINVYNLVSPQTYDTIHRAFTQLGLDAPFKDIRALTGDDVPWVSIHWVYADLKRQQANE